MIEAVLLDAGNTLVEIDYDYVARAVRQAGGDASPDDVRRAERHARVGLDETLTRRSSEAPDTFRRYLDLVFENLPGRPPREPDFVFEAIAARGNLWCRADPEAGPTLARLRAAGYRLGVVSNSDGSVERILRDLGLRHFLEVVVDSAVVGVEKPDPGIFAPALQALGVRPDRAVHVGDLPAVDLAGARAAGIRGILVDPLGLWAGRVPERRIRTLGELPALLEKSGNDQDADGDV